MPERSASGKLPAASQRISTTVPRGTMITTEPVSGEPCRYRLCYDTTLLPLRLTAAAMGGLPLDAPPLGLAQAKGVLRLSLAGNTPEVEMN